MDLRAAVATAAAALFAAGLQAGDYYVDGAKGADLPGAGTAGSPWKTIQYAMQQVPPSGTHTVYVAGLQTYSATTNGESFPVVVASNVMLMGVDRPVLEVPPLGIGLLLAPDTDYDYDRSRIEHFSIRNGARGIDLGALEGFEHSLQIRDCWFFDQTEAGVRIEPEYANGHAVSTHHVRVFASHFEGGKHGVFINSRTQYERQDANGQSVVIEIPSCSFHDLSGSGVRVQHKDSVDFLRVKSFVIGCSFERCNRGIEHIIETAEDNEGSYNEIVTTARHCQFVGSNGVFSLVALFPPATGGSPLPKLVVEECIFDAGPTQTAIRGTAEKGAYEMVAKNNTMVGFQRGIDLSVAEANPNVSPDVVATFERQEMFGGDVGVSLSGDAASEWTVTSSRNRVLDQRIGAEILGMSPASAVQMASSMYVDGETGIHLNTSADVDAVGLTLVDNSSEGLLADAYGVDSSFANVLFANNGAHAAVSGPLPIEYSLFENLAYPGPGNQDITDPGLLRPSYKLAENSPCRDAGDPTTPAGVDYEGNPRPTNGMWDIGASEYVPTGSLQPHGVAGWGRWVFHPNIGSPQTAVHPGQDLTIELQNAIDSRQRVPVAAYLMVGPRDDVSIRLPGAPGSHVWISLIAQAGPFLVDADGSLALQFALPDDPVIVGLHVSFQWLLLMPTANQRGVVTTDALRVTVGESLTSPSTPSSN